MTSLLFDGHIFTPGKVVCIGRNYAEHIKELGNEVPDDMVVFNKPASSIGNALLAFHEEPLHFETELCLLIRDGHYVGIAVGLDLTKREQQSQLKAKGLPWERAKAFEGSALFSEFIPLQGNISDYSFTLHIDGELTQQGDPSLMLYKPDVIFNELERFMPLQDNDILMTGTPKGVGQVIMGAEFCLRLYKKQEPVIEQIWKGQ
ncbi:MAG: fumarylacetoacetate hydrolase family protein [Reinekea sp.]|jgi:2-keto-4-pentenoate hydratase/2-oxohepta-3-ene-1,7-dioic acid hydratase in catechol pathway